MAGWLSTIVDALPQDSPHAHRSYSLLEGSLPPGVIPKVTPVKTAKGKQTAPSPSPSPSPTQKGTAGFVCRPCKKSFKSEATWEAHLSSSKHIKQVQVVGSPSENVRTPPVATPPSKGPGSSAKAGAGESKARKAATEAMERWDAAATTGDALARCDAAKGLVKAGKLWAEAYRPREAAESFAKAALCLCGGESGDANAEEAPELLHRPGSVELTRTALRLALLSALYIARLLRPYNLVSSLWWYTHVLRAFVPAGALEEIMRDLRAGRVVAVVDQAKQLGARLAAQRGVVAALYVGAVTGLPDTKGDTESVKQDKTVSAVLRPLLAEATQYEDGGEELVIALGPAWLVHLIRDASAAERSALPTARQGVAEAVCRLGVQGMEPHIDCMLAQVAAGDDGEQRDHELCTMAAGYNWAAWCGACRLGDLVLARECADRLGSDLGEHARSLVDAWEEASAAAVHELVITWRARALEGEDGLTEMVDVASTIHSRLCQARTL